ncbi:MAG: hypothetical protein LBC95_00515 [Candidatus Nomurabacteria bacterium]|nr:hypothetical protein [Candidatus Nomurabacteria bacterium]
MIAAEFARRMGGRFLQNLTHRIIYFGSGDDAGDVNRHIENDLNYLEQEVQNLTHVNQHAPTLAPQLLIWKNGVMLTELLDSYHWLAPGEALGRYVLNAIEAFDSLGDLPRDPRYDDSAVDELVANGWGAIDFSQIHYECNFDTKQARRLGAAAAANIATDHIAHHDARQTNIAWHPENGSRLIDLS